jgi:transcriptional regulator with XRE-family HTH domain
MQEQTQEQAIDSALPRLNEVRVQKGLTMRQLAEKSGVNTATIQLIEKRGRKPHDLTVQKLADALEVERAELYFPGHQVAAVREQDAMENEVLREQLANMTDEQLRELMRPMQRRFESVLAFGTTQERTLQT